MKITVAIATIGRASLLDTLKSLQALITPPSGTLEIIVGDDALDGAGLRLVETFEPGDLDLKTVSTNARNIATCRNACVEAAGGEWIAFIDDDECADRNWLIELLKAIETHDADAAFGKIISTYPEETPDWLTQADPIGRLRARADGSVTTGSSGNAIVRRAALFNHALRFDERLGRTGGEDTDLFQRLHAAGGKLHFTNTAIVREVVPPQKATVAFFKARALRSGQSFAEITLSQPDAPWRPGFYAAAMAKAIIAFMASIVLWPFNRSEAFIFRLKAIMNLGKLRHAVGLKLPEIYKSISA